MRFRQLEQILGTVVAARDGTVIGQVAAVHVVLGGDEPLLMQVDTGSRDEQLLLPAGDAVVREGLLHLPYERGLVDRGPTVDSDVIVSAGEAAYVLDFYGAGRANLGSHRVDERVIGPGDVAAQDPDVRWLPPIVVVKPSIQDTDGNAANEPDREKRPG